MNLDAKFNGQAFRRDFVDILAQNRHLATLGPARLANNTDGYPAGQVLARNTVSNLFEKYSAVSGTYPAACILYQPVSYPEDFSGGGTGTNLSQAVFGGEVKASLCTDLSSQAITDLNGREFTDQTGITVFKF